MPQDPDSQIDAVSAFIDTEVASIASLTSQLAAAIAAQGTIAPDSASQDVLDKLNALQAKIAAIQNPPAPATPPASS